MAAEPMIEPAANRAGTPWVRPLPAPGRKQGGRIDVVAALWRGLRRPWLAGFAGLLALVLGIAALTLPQLPGQLVDEPATAARRLIAASGEFGSLGDLYRVLGLFDVTHSMLLRLTLALLALIGLVHLADLFAVARLMRRLSSIVRTSMTQADQPLMLPGDQAVARLRANFSDTPKQNADAIAGVLAHRFAQVERHDPDSTESVGAFGGDEIRFVALRNQLFAYARPLVAIGMLIALVGAWTATTFGWNVQTGLLAPGETYRSAARDIQIEYGGAPSKAASGESSLSVRIGEERAVHAIDGDGAFRVGRGSVLIHARAPGILVMTDDGAPALLRAGESVPSGEIGLVFPATGSEESILLPRYSTGLRVVRMPSEGSEQYAVEIYRSDSLGAAERQVFDGRGEHAISLENGPTLRFRFMPAIEVDIRALPGVVWVWIGLGLSLLGAPAFFRAPSYIVLQLRPWFGEQTLLIAQSNSHAEIDAIAAWLEHNPAPDEILAQPVTQTPTMVAR